MRDEHAPRADELGHVAVDERQKERGDVMPVGVGVGEKNHTLVAKLVELEALSETAAESLHEIGELLVLENFRERRLLDVQDLAAKRQHRLFGAVATLLRRSAGRVAFHDEDLRFRRPRRSAIGQFAGQHQPRLRGGVASHRRRGRA